MFKIIREKLYLLGYIIIMYSIGQFGYIGFNLAHDISNNKERTVIDSNSITTIGKMHFNHINIFLWLIYSIALILLGVFIIKKRNKNRLNNTI
ncbi:hypothetical protein G9F71_026780 [Clostridium sp. FP2]|uniref:hypothetical protein n=1 Tax=Clostridium sp. FP2 TaxID=2724481 RepID=UPI0013E92086|nr:hypothetical protein [Clostridium sp. FP2]MBZ9626412.1 hypothetical protein [Clostridium sp. FP2]